MSPHLFPTTFISYPSVIQGPSCCLGIFIGVTSFISPSHEIVMLKSSSLVLYISAFPDSHNQRSNNYSSSIKDTTLVTRILRQVWSLTEQSANSRMLRRAGNPTWRGSNNISSRTMSGPLRSSAQCCSAR